jgi:hypothetical protein
VARHLFDVGIFSVIDDASAIGVGWLLNFYTATTTTRIYTYTEASAGSANTNPVVADADGRFPAIWIDDGQTIKWSLTDADGGVILTRDNYNIPASPPSFDPALDNFLAGNSPLAIPNGGTGATSAVNALGALGALPAAGGTVTDDITRSTRGVYLYNSAAGQVNGGVFVTIDSDPDPTSAAGEWWAKYA